MVNLMMFLLPIWSRLLPLPFTEDRIQVQSPVSTGIFFWSGLYFKLQGKSRFGAEQETYEWLVILERSEWNSVRRT